MAPKPKRKRAWCVTDHDTTSKHKKALENALISDDNVLRCIVALETSPKTKKKHLQCYIELKNAKTMSACKKAYFGGKSHLEIRRGTPFEAWSYCEMECKPLFTKGTPPTEAEDAPTCIWDLIKVDIDAGFDEYALMNEYPSSYARYSTGINKMLHQRDLHTKMNKWRNVTTTYMWGATGVGKTRTVLEMAESPTDVYRVTNYQHPFDGYTGQDIILFEEFRSSIKVEQMLIYLDGYYCALPCRYADKMANWSQVFIVSNISADDQYRHVQDNYPDTWLAFMRRVDKVVRLQDVDNILTEPATPSLSDYTLHKGD